MLYLGYNQSFVIDASAVDLLNYKRPDKSRFWFWFAEGDRKVFCDFLVFY